MGVVELVTLVGGGITGITVLGAYALAYGINRTMGKWGTASNRCPSLQDGRSNRVEQWRCDYEAGHVGPHHARRERNHGFGSEDVWWTDEVKPTLLSGGAGGLVNFTHEVVTTARKVKVDGKD